MTTIRECFEPRRARADAASATSLLLALAGALFACGGRVASDAESGDSTLTDAGVTSPDASDDAPDAGVATETDAAALDAAFDAASDPALAKCFAGVDGNALHFETDAPDPLYPDNLTLTSADGTWTGKMDTEAIVDIQVKDSSASLWGFDFAAPHFAPVQVGTYAPITKAHPYYPEPTLQLIANDRWCDAPNGSVHVARIDTYPYTSNPKLLRFAASFRLTCAGSTAVVRGCIRFEQP